MNGSDDAGSESQWRRWNALSRLLLVMGALLIVGGVLAGVLGGFGHRWGWWHVSTGFSMLRWGVYVILAGAGFATAALLSAVLSKRLRPALVASATIALAAGVLSVPLGHWLGARDVPPIHDISTDLDDPPPFVALRTAREAAPNRVDHPGETAARLQRQAYPDVGPIRLAAEREAVFTAAEAVARDLGWRIVDADPRAGRIEAVDRTFWFGFYDDVAIWIAEAEDERTRVDIRSASRVGRGDAGTNARRIGAFLARLQDRL